MPSEQKIIVMRVLIICVYFVGIFRIDSTEEFVGQSMEKLVVNEHKYLPEQIRIEYTLQVGSNKPRADIVIWEKGADQTQGTIKLIIECKKETVDARNAKDGIAQLKSYMSVCPNCEWGMWTNSVQKYVFRKAVDAAGNITFMEYNDIPSADGNLDEVNRPSRTSLKNAYDDNLLFVFKTCHNHIYVNDGMQKQPAFFELLKVIFCKIEDERNIPNPLEFYTTSEERSNPDGQLTVQKRIGKIFQRVKKRHGKIFDANDEIKLSPRSLAYIVSELQRYSLLNTKIDIKGKAYLRTLGKYYIVDIGLRNYLLGFRNRDSGHAIENVVYFELLRRGYDVAIGKIGNGEVDFIATTADEKKYIQVTESMMSEDVRKRELAPLQSIRDNYEKIVLSLEPGLDTSYDGIKSENLIDWLLNE